MASSRPRALAALSPTLVLTLAVPIATLVAAAVTLYHISGPTLDTVGEPVERVGRVQQTDLEPYRTAAALGLGAELVIDGDRARVAITGGSGAADGVDGLVLHLEHPIEAQLDRDLPLLYDGSHWHLPGFDAGVNWRVSLAPSDGHWRLVGVWRRGSTRLALEPALKDGHARR